MKLNCVIMVNNRYYNNILLFFITPVFVKNKLLSYVNKKPLDLFICGNGSRATRHLSVYISMYVCSSICMPLMCICVFL